MKDNKMNMPFLSRFIESLARLRNRFTKNKITQHTFNGEIFYFKTISSNDIVHGKCFIRERN